MPVIPVHTETEAGRLANVIGQRGIHSKFQVSTQGDPVSKQDGAGWWGRDEGVRGIFQF